MIINSSNNTQLKCKNRTINHEAIEQSLVKLTKFQENQKRISFLRYVFLTLLIIQQVSQQITYASLIVGDSAIEIKEFDQGDQNGPQQQTDVQSETQQPNQDQQNNNQVSSSPNLILGTLANDNDYKALTKHLLDGNQNQLPAKEQDQKDTNNDDTNNSILKDSNNADAQTNDGQQKKPNTNQMPGPLQLSTYGDDVSQNVLADHGNDENNIDGKRISGKVVDFELDHAGGHNKAKIKKKKKKKKAKEEEVSSYMTRRH